MGDSSARSSASNSSSFKRILHCGCLPKIVFGMNIDNLFAYYTPKVVAIQDRSLGLMRILAMIVIFLYIFVYNIWYQGQHFTMSEVEGISRQDWQEPTQWWCNPRHLDCKANYSRILDLPYCRQYQGWNASRVQRPCKYFDARELPMTLSSGTLIPTYIQKFKQVKDCEEGDTICERKFHFVDDIGMTQRGHGLAEPLKRFYVADVEDFALTLDHSFRTTDGKVAYDDFLMNGYWSVCDKDLNRADPNYHKEAALVPRQRHCRTQPIKCLHWKCLEFREDSTALLQQATHGAHHSLRSKSTSRMSTQLKPHELLEIEEGEAAAEDCADRVKKPTPQELAVKELSGENQTVIGMKGGDVLTLKMLLRMAGESLDETWDDEDEGALNLRLRGTALMVNIHYDNVEPWTLVYPRDPPWYTISVTSRPAHKFMHGYISGETEEHREITWAYGVYVIVKQTGHIRTFNLVQALMTLTAATVLLGLSDFLVTMLAVYLLPKKHKYRKLMYDYSEEIGGGDSDEETTLLGTEEPAKESKPVEAAQGKADIDTA